MPHRAGIYEKIIKRPLDLLLSGLGLLFLSWLFLILAVLVKRNLGSPVLFKQERPGRHGRIFRLCKFRSMTDAVGSDGSLLSDEQRLTGFGRRLRSTSLDELPELWNIFRGDMSIVGPRPLLVKYLPRYNERQTKRHDVRPGLTGWAQINGRNALSWEERLEMDVWYTEHVSFLLDAKIFFLTVRSVLRQEGISSESSATMEEFMGTETSDDNYCE